MQINQQMLTLVNAARQKVAANPLCLCSKLVASASKQAQYEASVNQMTHDGPVPLLQRFTDQGFQPLSVAENAARTENQDVAAVEQALESDPAHLSNIDGTAYTYFGVGVAQGSDGKFYWTQHFAQAATPSPELCDNGTPAVPGAPTCNPYNASAPTCNPYNAPAPAGPFPISGPSPNTAPQFVCMNGQCFQMNAGCNPNMYPNPYSPQAYRFAR